MWTGQKQHCLFGEKYLSNSKSSDYKQIVIPKLAMPCLLNENLRIRCGKILRGHLLQTHFTEEVTEPQEQGLNTLAGRPGTALKEHRPLTSSASTLLLGLLKSSFWGDAFRWDVRPADPTHRFHPCVMSLATRSSAGRCRWGGKGR